jgi:hypothetical protein
MRGPGGPEGGAEGVEPGEGALKELTGALELRAVAKARGLHDGRQRRGQGLTINIQEPSGQDALSAAPEQERGDLQGGELSPREAEGGREVAEQGLNGLRAEGGADREAEEGREGRRALKEEREEASAITEGAHTKVLTDLSDLRGGHLRASGRAEDEGADTRGALKGVAERHRAAERGAEQGHGLRLREGVKGLTPHLKERVWLIDAGVSGAHAMGGGARRHHSLKRRGGEGGEGPVARRA